MYTWIAREPRCAIQLQGAGAYPQVSVRGMAEARGQITEAEKKIRERCLLHRSRILSGNQPLYDLRGALYESVMEAVRECGFAYSLSFELIGYHKLS